MVQGIRDRLHEAACKQELIAVSYRRDGVKCARVGRVTTILPSVVYIRPQGGGDAGPVYIENIEKVEPLTVADGGAS